MKPLVEIVIHDLKKGEICYINGGLSKRKIADSSLLTETFEKDLNQKVYSKMHFDGRPIRCISVPLDDQWMICINVDASVFYQMKQLVDTFFEAEKDKPESLFKNDWQEKIHQVIHDFLKKEGWSFERLTQSQKKEITRYLFDVGAFLEKKAADYIASILGLGRATIFNYLKEWRKK